LTDTVQILGLEGLKSFINDLPGKVVLKIMNAWTLDQARQLRQLGRAGAPVNHYRRRRRRRGHTIAQRISLKRAIKASRVTKGLRKFGKETVSRSLSYGAGKRGTRATNQNIYAKHFMWNVQGTKERVQKSTGRRTGVMPVNPWWSNAVKAVVARAQADVYGGLKRAYDQEMQREVNRVVRRYGSARLAPRLTG
jgi:hypothetical protein